MKAIALFRITSVALCSFLGSARITLAIKGEHNDLYTHLAHVWWGLIAGQCWMACKVFMAVMDYRAKGQKSVTDGYPNIDSEIEYGIKLGKIAFILVMVEVVCFAAAR